MAAKKKEFKILSSKWYLVKIGTVLTTKGHFDTYQAAWSSMFKDGKLIEGMSGCGPLKGSDVTKRQRFLTFEAA